MEALGGVGRGVRDGHLGAAGRVGVSGGVRGDGAEECADLGGWLEGEGKKLCEGAMRRWRRGWTVRKGT